jgi:hypothetical protein
MKLRSGKHLPPAPLKRVNRHKSRPFRLLDLPTELRLMIYRYTIGYHTASWTMTHKPTPISGYVLALGHMNASTNNQRNPNLKQTRIALLQTCKQVSEEASVIFYDQTRFDISFYENAAVEEEDSVCQQLHLTHMGAKIMDGLAANVLRRVKHIAFNFRNKRRHYTHMWLLFLLCRFLDHGAFLNSLRFIEHGNAVGLRYYYDSLLNFNSYRGNAVLELCNAAQTDEEVVQLRETLRCMCYSCFCTTLR